MRSANPLKAGLFIVISFAIALGLFFAITASTLFNGPRSSYTVVFDLTEDVGGLAVGSEVRIGGLKVGSVRSIDLASHDGHPAIVATFSIPQRYAIKRDANVVVQAGLTGTVNLNITHLGNDPAVATINDRLDGQPGALAVAIEGLGDVGNEITTTLQAWRPRVSDVLDEAKPRVNTTLDQIKVTAATADETIKHIRSKIDPAYDKYAGVADAATGAMANLDDILGDTKGDIRKTMANLSGSTGTLKDRLPEVMEKISTTLDGFKTALDKTAVILDETKETAINAKDVTASIRSVINGNRGRIDEIIKSANLTSANLAGASSEIRSAPWRLLYKPNPNEVANQNLYDATRQFADASRKLQDSAQALRDSIQDPKADAAHVQTLLDKLNADFANYQKIEAVLWDSVKK